MAIAFRSASSYGTSASSATHALPNPAGVADGDVLVAVISVNVSTVTISPPSGVGWVAVTGTPLVNGTVMALFAWVKPVTSAASEPATHTFTSSATTNAQGGIAAYSGVDNTTIQDATATTTTNVSSTSVDLPAITPVTAGAWAIRIAEARTATTVSTFTPPAGHTEEIDACASGTVAKAPVELSDVAWSGSGAVAATTATVTTAGVGSGISMALKPSGGGAPPPPPPDTGATQMHIVRTNLMNG